MFNSLTNRPAATPSPEGEKVYSYTYELDGKPITEEWQIHDEIQSYANDCIVQNLIKRYEQTGDPAILNSRKGYYEDVSDMPSDLTEAYQAVKTAEKVAKHLEATQKKEPEKEPEKEVKPNEHEEINK